jgi:hypothetical protein
VLRLTVFLLNPNFIIPTLVDIGQFYKGKYIVNKGTKSKVDINKKESYKQPPYDHNSVQVTITPR